MLIDFRFKNYKSFRDEQVLSLVGSRDNKYSYNLIELNNLKDIKLLPSIVLYGANASGKTNVLDALNFCRRFILRSAKYDPGKKIPIKPFMLDDTSQDEPTEFDFTFIQKNIRYQYGFVVTQETVLEEWLISYPKGRARNLFRRKYEEEVKNTVYKFSSYLKGEKEKLKEVTGPNSLFLSVGAIFNNQELSSVYKWFSENLRGTKASKLEYQRYSELLSNEKYLNKIRELIRFADFGIIDVTVAKQKFDFDSELPDDAPESLVNAFKALNEFVKVSLEESNEEPATFKVDMFHKKGKSSIPFTIHDESDGTQQYFALSFPILNALLNGYVLFVDELDSSLHPLLVRSIVNLFHDPSINTKGAQLIFNTHDTTLLKFPLFRRDQIWFVEKDKNGSSHIYSLLEFSPRKDEALGKGYLQGRYGAIPYLGEIPREVFQIG